MATNSHLTARRALLCAATLAALTAATTALHGASRSTPPAHAAVAETVDSLDADELDLMGNAGRVADSKKPKLTAYFARESYARGDGAELVILDSAARVSVQIKRAGTETEPTMPSDVMLGSPVTRPVPVGSVHGRRVVRIHVGRWPSGVYFAQLTSGDRVGYAP